MARGFHCPKCALPVVSDGKAWRCTSGGLELAPGLGRALAEKFAHDLPEAVAPQPMRVGTWYCPLCARRLGPSYACLCGASLREHVFKLVEHHPHADGQGGFV